MNSDSAPSIVPRAMSVIKAHVVDRHSVHVTPSTKGNGDRDMSY